MCNILEYWKIITYYLVYMSWYLKPISQEWCHFPACLKRPKRFIAPRFPKVAVGVGLSYAPAMLVQKIRSAPAVSLDDIDGWTTIWHMAGSFFSSTRVRVLYNFQVVQDLSHGFLWMKIWRWCFVFPEARTCGSRVSVPMAPMLFL